MESNQSSGNHKTKKLPNSRLDALSSPRSKMVIFLLLLVGSGYGLAFAILGFYCNPAVLAMCLSWLIAFFTSALTSKIFFRLDLKRHRFLRWEHEGRIYERVGVRTFQWVVLHTPLGWLNPIVRRPGDLDHLLRELSMAEGVHWVGGGVSLAFAAGFILAGYTFVGIWLVILSIPLHVYPVMLQRFNRGRVLRVLRRLDARGQLSGEPSRDSIGN